MKSRISQLLNKFRTYCGPAALCGFALFGADSGARAAMTHHPIKAYVSNFKDNTVSVIDTEARKVIATVPVTAGPHGMAISPDGRTVYVSGDASSTISVIDTTSDRVVQTLKVGKTLNGLAMASDGSLLLAAVYGEDRVAFIDPATGETTANVAVMKPHAITISPDGKSAYVASQEQGHFALAKLDLGAHKVARTLPLAKTPRDVEFSYDGKNLYFTLAGANAIQVLDAASDQVLKEIPTGVSPHIAGYYRGTNVGVGVVQGPGELLLFDPQTHVSLHSVAVGKQPHWVATTSDGHNAYVTNEGGNSVTVVDLETKQTNTIEVGSAPRKVVIQPVSARETTVGSKISINNFSFIPADITVAPGEVVVWNNDDGAPHGLEFQDGASGTNLLLPGQTFSRRFDRPGTYEYQCSVHPYMTGRVIVRSDTAAK